MPWGTLSSESLPESILLYTKRNLVMASVLTMMLLILSNFSLNFQRLTDKNKYVVEQHNQLLRSPILDHYYSYMCKNVFHQCPFSSFVLSFHLSN
jgi:hypothetical protein